MTSNKKTQKKVNKLFSHPFYMKKYKGEFKFLKKKGRVDWISQLKPNRNYARSKFNRLGDQITKLH